MERSELVPRCLPFLQDFLKSCGGRCNLYTIAVAFMPQGWGPTLISLVVEEGVKQGIWKIQGSTLVLNSWDSKEQNRSENK